MTELSSNESANHGYSIADDIVRDVLDYLASPRQEADLHRNFGDLKDKANALKSALWEASSLRVSGVFGPPSSGLLDLLESIDRFATDALVRTHGLSIQAAQLDLQRDIRVARDFGSP